jgi:hypothetical protein
MGRALIMERQDRGAVDPFLCCRFVVRRRVDAFFG